MITSINEFKIFLESNHKGDLVVIKPTDMLYHKGNPAFRDKIEKEGLRCMKGDSYNTLSPDEAPAVFAYMNDVNYYDTTFDDDIWVISPDAPNVWYRDMAVGTKPYRAIVTYTDVPREYLQLIHRGTGEDFVYESASYQFQKVGTIEDKDGKEYDVILDHGCLELAMRTCKTCISAYRQRRRPHEGVPPERRGPAQARPMEGRALAMAGQDGCQTLRKFKPRILSNMKGELNGTCNLSSCTSKQPATWYNHGSREHYCEKCAKRLNADPFNRRDAHARFGHELCTPAAPEPSTIQNSLH
jgi:hypothetical protein